MSSTAGGEVPRMETSRATAEDGAVNGKQINGQSAVKKAIVSSSRELTGGDEEGQDSDEEPDDKNNKGKPASKGPRVYNYIISTAVHDRFDLPHDVAISAIELLTYFPKHATIWPELLFRLVRNDFSVQACAFRQLYARGNVDEGEYTRRCNTLRKALKTAGVRKFNDPAFTVSSYKKAPRLHPALQPYQMSDVPAGGQVRHLYHVNRMNTAAAPPSHVRLSSTAATLRELANGVVQHPPLGQRGVLTKCILWAIANNELRNYDTTEIMDIVRMPANKFTADVGAGTLTWDQDGLANTQAIPRP